MPACPAAALGLTLATFLDIPRHTALRVVQQLILDDTQRAHDDLTTLLEVMQSTPSANFGARASSFLCRLAGEDEGEDED